MITEEERIAAEMILAGKELSAIRYCHKHDLNVERIVDFCVNVVGVPREPIEFFITRAVGAFLDEMEKQ